MAATADATSVMQQAVSNGVAANPAKSDDANLSAPQTMTSEQVQARAGLDPDLTAALLELRRTFKARYLPKRSRFISEAMRAFEALRGNTYALLNDQSAALDTINQLMQGFLGQGDDPQLYAHNDNIYQAFGLIFIAALMVDLGKVRYQPADAQEDDDLFIAKKGSTIQAFNERKNNIAALMQLKLLFLWLTGSFFRYTRYVVSERDAGTSRVPQIQMKPTKVAPDGYVCPSCGSFVPESKAMTFSSSARCPKCGAGLGQKDYFEGPMMELPVKVGEIEAANGMTKIDIVNGLCVDANPDAMELKETEILDYQIETSVGRIRVAYPTEYGRIQPNAGTDAASDGDAGRMARAGMTTPGSNNKAITAQGIGTFTRCWFQPEAFGELEDETRAKKLLALFPKGCKMVLWGEDVVLDVQHEALLDHWTWCGTVRGAGLYPFAVGKVVLDIQERTTGAVNKIDAYMDRVAFGTMLFDANYIDGDAMQNKVLSPGNLTGVSRIDEETGQRVPLSDLFMQMKFQIDPAIYNYVDNLTARAQFLCGVLPTVVGASDPHNETARGKAQDLKTAMGRLMLYINQMRWEDADAARLSVQCSIDNMDEEIKIVEPGAAQNSWQTVKLLKAELTGDFFTYPETDEGYPATFEEIQDRIMQLLADNPQNPFINNLLGDPDVAAVVGHYLLPPGIELTGEPDRAKAKSVIEALWSDKNGPVMAPNPVNPQMPPVVLPSIMPEIGVDDPSTWSLMAKKSLQQRWEEKYTNQAGYANVLALLKICSQMQKEQQAEQVLSLQSAASQKAPPRGQRQL